jgi:hypothetical protein
MDFFECARVPLERPLDVPPVLGVGVRAEVAVR